MYDYLDTIYDNKATIINIKSIINNITDIISISNNTLNIREEDEVEYIEFKISEYLDTIGDQYDSVDELKTSALNYLKIWMIEFLHYLGLMEVFEIEDTQYPETITFREILDIYNGCVEFIRNSDVDDINDTEELYTELSKLTTLDNLYRLISIVSMKLKELNLLYKEQINVIKEQITTTNKYKDIILNKIEVLKSLNELFVNSSIVLDLIDVDYNISKLGSSSEIIEKYMPSVDDRDESLIVVPIIFLLCRDYDEASEYVYGLGDIGDVNIEAILMSLDSLYTMSNTGGEL